MENEIISILEFSKRIGVNEKTIRKAIELGKITAGLDTSGKKPKIIYDIALKEVEEMNIGFKSKSLRADKLKSVGSVDIPPSEDENIPEVIENFKSLTVDTAPFKESRRREAFFKSELSRLELEEKEGTLVKKDDVYKELFVFGNEIKTKILAIPDRITDELISLSNDRDAFYHLLYGNLRDTLELLNKSKTILDR
ncbi:MAG: hypothetical protein LBQ74_00040 [Prevotella sp.]|jgi:hypothetical protein|nr:hypothetical protein [Prevotella sp.]